MTSKLNVTELDFNKIKENLKIFLASQDQFKDYNFEASGLSVLIDLLAYNTAYNAFYGNMIANEMFLDSAIVRDSVVSRAKAIGYTPHSVRSAIAYVNLKFNLVSLPYTLPKYTTFTTTIDDVDYTFSTDDNLVLQDYTQADITNYTVQNVKIIEGDVLDYNWTYDSSTTQRFIIPNDNVDVSTLYVEVQQSKTDLSKNIYYKVNDLNVLTPDSLVYFLQETEDQKHEIIFGDDVLGKALVNGNIINIFYRVSHGSAANGATAFGDVSDARITGVFTLYAAANGVDIESINSVKYYAPKTYEAQNRAVTKQDYQTLILTESPNLNSVRVWGGEEEDPPQYGFVMICPKPIYGEVLTPTAKVELTDNILAKRNVVGVRIKIVDPEYLKLIITSEVHYDSTKTNYSEGQLQTQVTDAIESFSANSLSNFDAPFRYSTLCKTIDAVDDAILNDETTLKLKISISPTPGSHIDYTLKFNNAIDTGDVLNGAPTLTSTLYTQDGITLKLEDDGLGKIKSYQYVNPTTKYVYEQSVGTINYSTGEVVLNNFGPNSIQGDTFDIIVTPARRDISSVRNQIITIQNTDINIVMVDENVGQ